MPFVPTCAMCWHPRCSPATSWSWITYQPTRSATSVPSSRRQAPGCCNLPPYSPDFNPIENAFSKLKASFAQAAARSITELWNTIGSAH